MTDQRDQMPDFMRDDTPVDLSSLAPDDKIATVRAAAEKYAKLDAEIREMEEVTLPAKKKEREELARMTLPSMFESIGTDHIGVPGQNVDVVIVPYYHANIKSEWPEPQRNAAFDHLENDLELGSIVSVDFTMTFRRGELELAKEFETLVRDSKFGNTHPLKRVMGVPWNTLTASLREVVQRGDADKIDLEKLGATFGQTAKVKKRKAK